MKVLYKRRDHQERTIQRHWQDTGRRQTNHYTENQNDGQQGPHQKLWFSVLTTKKGEWKQHCMLL